MQRFKNILILANQDGVSDAVITRARWLAETNDAMITVADVWDSTKEKLSRLLSELPSANADRAVDRVLKDREDRLTEMVEPLTDAGLTVSTKLLQGVGFLEVIQHVLAHGHDLVLKAADSTPVKQMFRGPDLHLMRKCPCPVWILNSATEPTARRIIAAVDTDPRDNTRSALNHKVMQLATSLARHDDAKLHVVNAWFLAEEAMLRSSLSDTPDCEIGALLSKIESESAQRLDTLVRDYSAFSDLMRVVHVKGSPADVVTEHAETERIDTIVMGTLGRTTLAGFFTGNTAETILNRVDCSVLAVKPEGFVSPVTLDQGSAR